MTLEEVATGTKRLLEIDGKRIEVTSRPASPTASASASQAWPPDKTTSTCEVKVKPHPVSPATATTCTATADDAARGAARWGGPVRTLTGRVLLRIPPETQNGETFRLKGKGLPHFRSEGRGDLLREGPASCCRRDLSDEAKEAAEKFLDLVDQPNHAQTSVTALDIGQPDNTMTT